MSREEERMTALRKAYGEAAYRLRAKASEDMRKRWETYEDVMHTCLEAAECGEPSAVIHVRDHWEAYALKEIVDNAGNGELLADVRRDLDDSRGAAVVIRGWARKPDATVRTNTQSVR